MIELTVIALVACGLLVFYAWAYHRGQQSVIRGGMRILRDINKKT